MKENKILEEGYVSSAELAEWFGIKLNSYQHAKKKKLEILKDFAEYESKPRGVNITKVKIPVYAKHGSQAYELIKENFHNAWHKSGYDTAARAGSQLWREVPGLCDLISETTAKQYTARVRKEFYGRVHASEHGIKGSCRYAYVKDNAWEEAILLTAEQSQEIKRLTAEIYSNEQEPLLYESLVRHEITQEDYDAAIAEWNSEDKRAARYSRFIEGVAEILGFVPAKVTMIEDEIYFCKN